MKLHGKILALAAALLLLADRGLSAATAPASALYNTPASPTPTFGQSYTDTSDGGHAILADGLDALYTNITVRKTGNAESDSDGENAAVLAENGAELTLRAVSVVSEGAHASAVYSLGADTLVSIADSTVTASGTSSAGLMAARGGTLLASNLVVRAAGEDMAALRAESGASLLVTGGAFDASGARSPAIYAASHLAVSDAELSAAAAQGVIVDGPHTVTLQNVTLTANHTAEDAGQAVLLTGGAEEDNAAVFTMTGGSLTNLSGDVFLVTGADAAINLTGVTLVNDDPDGVFLRLKGESGQSAALKTAAQRIDGDLLADPHSVLSVYLCDGSVLTGAVNAANEGAVDMVLTDGATWTLTGDSHLRTLDCESGSVDLNGHSLTVGGEVYTEA